MYRKLFTIAFGLVALLLAVIGIGTATASAGSDKEGTALQSQADLGCPVFTDVPEGSTFYDYVRCLACRSIITGYPDNTFRPNNSVTRGQLAKIVSESAGFNGNPGLQLFEDVPPGSPFYDYVNRLTQFGYVSGYNCGGPGEPCSPQGYRYFRPNAPATRAQISKIISQAAGWNEPAGNQMFEDVPTGHPFYDYIQRMAAHNAVSGYPCGGLGEPCVAPANLPYFRPNNNTTRGQVSKMDVTAFFAGECLVANK